MGQWKQFLVNVLAGFKLVAKLRAGVCQGLGSIYYYIFIVYTSHLIYSLSPSEQTFSLTAGHFNVHIRGPINCIIQRKCWQLPGVVSPVRSTNKFNFFQFWVKPTVSKRLHFSCNTFLLLKPKRNRQALVQVSSISVCFCFYLMRQRGREEK